MSLPSPAKFEISDLLGVGKSINSPAVHRLIDGIMNGVGRVYEDLLGPGALRRRSKAELEVALAAIGALPRLENLHLEVGGRASLRIQRENLIRQFNRENIALEAVQIAADEFQTQNIEGMPGVGIDKSWMRIFWDTSESVAEEHLQSMWARILVRKAISPSELNIRVLQRMASLSSAEVEQILKLAKFAIKIVSPDPAFPDAYGIVSNLGQYQGTFTVPEEKANLKDIVGQKLFPIDRVGLDSAGIMQSSNGWASEYGVPYSSQLTLIIGNKVFKLVDLPPPNERFLKFYHLGSGYGLTREGWEIARITNSAPDPEYLELLIQAIESAGCQLIEQESKS